MYPKNRSGAFLALLAAGGLYAWRNRDKIQGWVSKNVPTTPTTATYPSIGETRRIGPDGSGAETSPSDMPFGTGL